MQTEAPTTYDLLTLDGLRQSLLSPITDTGLQFRKFVIENLSSDPNTNLNPWKNGTRWITVTDSEKNKARVCITKKVWQKAIDQGYEISNDVAIDVAINGLTLDKWYQVQIDALAVRVSGQSQLEALRESIIKYCQAKGYFDRPKKPLPTIVRKIAIVTSQNSTIESDITHQIGIKKSFIDAYRFNGKADDLASMIRSIAHRREHDIICLYRGGREDEFMFVYSDPIVLDEVVNCPIPIVSAIGHERDNPPVQMVVDAGFASPSKFAAAINQRNIDALERAKQHIKSINNHLINYLSKIEKEMLLAIGNINTIASQLEQKQSAQKYKRTIVATVLISLLALAAVIFYFLSKQV